MKSLRVVTLVPLLLFACVQAANAQYQQLVVFGDSLSDTGNLAAASPEAGVVLNTPPFYQGRVSNGPVAVDVLAKLMALPLTAFLEDGGQNFAVAGARAAAIGEQTEDAIRLASQVSFYLSASEPGPGTLVVIMIGGNDVRDAISLGRPAARRRLNAATSAIARQITRLMSAGVENFLVAGAPDISKIPETRAAAAQFGPVVTRNARAATAFFNARLGQKIKAIKAANVGTVRIAEADLVFLLATIAGNAQDYGFTVPNRACLALSESGIQYDRRCGPGPKKISQFVYFDSIHPTANVHERAGRFLYTLIPDQLNKE